MPAPGGTRMRPISFLATAVGAIAILMCGIFRKEIAEVLMNGALL